MSTTIGERELFRGQLKSASVYADRISSLDGATYVITNKRIFLSTQAGSSVQIPLSEIVSVNTRWFWRSCWVDVKTGRDYPVLRGFNPYTYTQHNYFTAQLNVETKVDAIQLASKINQAIMQM